MWPETPTDSSRKHAHKRYAAKAIKWIVTGSIVVLLLLALAETTKADDATGNERIHFDIPQQRADLALTQFAEQADLTLVFPIDEIKGRTANRLVGEYRIEEAVEKLLSGTGLLPTLKNQLVLNIAIADESKNEGEIMNTKKKAGLGAILAAMFSVGASAQEPVDTDEEAVALDEIVVTGTSIRGVYPESSPLQIFDSEDLKRSGVASIEQFFEKLPENHNSLSTGNAGAINAERNLENAGGIDLRGLGIGTTLVLLNGRRMALSSEARSPDISLIPIDAIERVEVLTDGASAIYGADAVAGVVNLILKDEFSGAHTALRYGGVTDGDMREFNARQAFGSGWKTGRGLISYSFLDRSPLDAKDRPFAGQLDPATLAPDDRRHNLLANIRQDGPFETVFVGDVLISARENSSETTTSVLGSRFRNDTDQNQYFVNLGLSKWVNDSLGAEFISTYSENTTEYSRAVFIGDLFDGTFYSDRETSNLEVSAKIDGDLLHSQAGTTKFSLGGGYSTEDYRVSNVSRVSGDLSSQFTERSTRYLFGELFFPAIGADQDVPAIEKLEVSIAARYTDYSDFGGKTSPKVGVLWSPVPSLNLRGTFGESFRAPFLSQLLRGSESSYALFSLAAFGFPDPFSSDDSSILFFVQGNGNANLGPEEATTSTLGFDFAPASLNDFRISATYFNIEYTDRVAVGDPTGGFTAVVAPDQFPDLFIVDPTTAFIAQAIDGVDISLNGANVDPNDPTAIAAVVNVALDNRIRNISSTDISGVDVQIAFGREFKDNIYVNGGIRAAHILEYTDQRTALAPVNERINTLFNPADLRMTGYLGFSNAAWTAQMNVNLVDDYKNPFGANGVESIDRWITVDLSLSHQFAVEQGSIFRGLTISASVQNLLDEDPPFVSVGGGVGEGLLSPVGYDPANASPVGRFVTVEISKKW